MKLKTREFCLVALNFTALIFFRKSRFSSRKGVTKVLSINMLSKCCMFPPIGKRGENIIQLGKHTFPCLRSLCKFVGCLKFSLSQGTQSSHTQNFISQFYHKIGGNHIFRDAPKIQRQILGLVDRRH